MPRKHKRGRSHRPGTASEAAASARGESATAPSATARRAMLRFVTAFVVSAIALFLVYWISDTTGRFDSVNRLNAILSGAILQVVGISNTRIGTTVQFGGGGMEVISECSGIYVAILFSAGVLAFPAAWRIRLTGVVLGVLAIFAVNVLRLVTLGAIIAKKRDLLPLFHEYLWQVLFILVVAGLYLLWIERMVPREQLDPAT